MYAKLAAEGFGVTDYWEVKNFGNLLQRMNGNPNDANEIDVSLQGSAMVQATDNHQSSGIGIDIEETDSMPRASDFREEAFYKMNFSSSEIAYCILQADPYASFAGLFAAKEAIVKADNAYKSRAFNSIVIEHTAVGKPIFHDFDLSISHTRTTAVAVGIRSVKSEPQLQEAIANKPTGSFSFSFSLVLVSLLLSLISIYLVWKRN
jgi:phosphopantetheine--protein transferase-like protein